MKQWTNHDIAYMQVNYGTVPAKVIAAHLGRTKNAVIMAAHRYKLGNPRYRNGSKADHNEIALLVARGVTVTNIAEIVDLHPQTIYWHIRSMPKWVREKSASNGRKSSAKASQKRMIEKYHGVTV